MNKYFTALIFSLTITIMIQARNLEHAIQYSENLTGRNIRIKVSKSFPEVPEFTNGAFQVGNGDCFMYMLYAEYLHSLGAKVVIDLPEMIKPYFRLATKLVLSDEVETTQFEDIQLADLYTILHDHIPNFDRSAPLFIISDELILKWDIEIKKRTGGILIPVVFFTNGAPHHEERFPANSEWRVLTTDMPHVLFIDAQYKGDEIPGSVRAREFCSEWDSVPYFDTMALVYAAVVLNNGFAISPDTGSLHLCASGLEGVKKAEGKIFGILGHCPDQRWRLNNFMTMMEQTDGVKINRSVWYPKSTLLFQQTEPGTFVPVMNVIKEQIKKKNSNV